MQNWQAILLGLIQGFTEPIPVSSSAQTQIAAFLMNVQTPGILFEVFLNFPSFLAILWLTRSDVVAITRDFFRYILKRDRAAKTGARMGLFIVLGTIPVMFTGVFMKDMIDTRLSGVTTTALFLVLTGALLFVVRHKKGGRTFEEMTPLDALLIGLIQGTLAVIPGVSRSGATLATALLLGLDRDASFRFSFLLYLPVGLGSMLLGGRELFTSSHFLESMVQYGMIFVAAYVATVYGFKLFRAMVRRGQLGWFTAYCWTVAALLLLFF